MIRVVCSAIIQQGNKFLMVKETKPSAAGKWGLPGGKLEDGESIVDGILREVNEETGYRVEESNLVGIVNKPQSHEGNNVVKFIFACTVSGKSTGPAEHEYAFLRLDEIETLDAQGLIRGKEIFGLLQSAANPESSEAPFLQII